MHLPFRRLLLIFSFGAFIAIAPAIILYAIGYRPITTVTPQSVGVALISTIPRGADISVNGAMYGTTPRSVPNLLPGIADIGVSKNGYQSWNKKLEIKPIQATDARSIKLIPSSPDVELITNDVAIYSVSPDSGAIAVVTPKHLLYVTDANGKFTTNVIPVPSDTTTLRWSDNSSHLLVSGKKSSITIIRFANQKIENITRITPTYLNYAVWSPNATRITGISKTNQLQEYDITTGTVTILAPSINAFAYSSGKLVYQNTDNSLVIGSESIDINEKILKLIPSKTRQLAMIVSSGDLITLNNDLATTTIAHHVLSALWSHDGLLLLVQTSPNEVNIYNAGNERLKNLPIHELHLITRLSTPILNSQWLFDNTHFMYEADGHVIMSEIDTRDHVITSAITALQKKSLVSYWIAPDGKSIINMKSLDATTTLVRTWLVTKEDR